VKNVDEISTLAKNIKKIDKSGVVAKGTVRITLKEATKAAELLGYRKTSKYSHGQSVYERISGNGPKYITLDVDAHSGGVWKGASSVENLASKTTRSGTYDASLKWIGD